jgi:hypothetical protein
MLIEAWYFAGIMRRYDPMDLHLVGIYIKELVKINFFIVPNFGVF